MLPKVELQILLIFTMVSSDAFYICDFVKKGKSEIN